MQWKKGACMPSEGFTTHIYTANRKAADIMQTTDRLVGEVLNSWGGFILKCHVPHELSIIRNLSSPPYFSNASLVQNGRDSFFYVYQTVKIWQTATLHNILRLGRSLFQDLSYLEEVASSQSQFTAGHHC